MVIFIYNCIFSSFKVDVNIKSVTQSSYWNQTKTYPYPVRNVTKNDPYHYLSSSIIYFCKWLFIWLVAEVQHVFCYVFVFSGLTTLLYVIFWMIFCDYVFDWEPWWLMSHILVNREYSRSCLRTKWIVT